MIWLRRFAKTFLILCAGAVAITLALLWRRRGGQPRLEALQAAVQETEQAVEEAKQVAVVQMRAARCKEQAMKDRLRSVTAIQDKARRREELLRLYQEASQ